MAKNNKKAIYKDATYIVQQRIIELERLVKMIESGKITNRHFIRHLEKSLNLNREIYYYLANPTEANTLH